MKRPVGSFEGNPLGISFPSFEDIFDATAMRKCYFTSDSFQNSLGHWYVTNNVKVSKQEYTAPQLLITDTGSKQL